MDTTNKTTSRGFRIIEFKDTYQQECSLQKSSAAGHDCIWLGQDKPQILEGTPYARMHLTREMVAELLPMLQFFVETGELPSDDPERDIAVKEAEQAYQRKRMEALQIAVDWMQEILESEE